MPLNALRSPLPARARTALVELALLAALGGFFALVELRQPFYFLQDDNRTAQLPLFVHHVRGLAGGELPLYNFHQYLGMPSFAVGSLALFYPPVYAAVALSQVLFGFPDAAVELLIAVHFAVGLVGMHRLLRHLRLSMAAAAFGALTWPLNSMVVYTATSWWNVVGIVAWLPWMLLLALRLAERPHGRTLAALVGVRAALLYVGHVQLFVYAVCFEALCAALAALATKERRLRPLLRALGPYALSLFLGAAVALPLVQPMWHHVAQSSDRGRPISYGYFHGDGFDLLSWVQGAVAPFDDDGGHDELPLGWHEIHPYLSFAGHLALVLILVAPFLARRGIAARLPMRVFAIPLLVAFLWTMGALDRLLFLVPVLNRFRWHWRLNVFVMFFLVVVAAMAFSALEGAARQLLGRRVAVALAAAALLVQAGELALLYGAYPQRSFSRPRLAERPPLREPLAERLRSGRIVSLGWRTDDPYAAAQLGFDYASQWGLFHYAGYVNLLSRSHAQQVVGIASEDVRRMRFDGVWKGDVVPFRHFEDWGVSWYVLAKNHRQPEETEGYRAQLAEHGLRLVADEPARLVFHDSRAAPLVALIDGDRCESLAPRVGGRSLTVRFAPAPRPRSLVFAFLALPELAAESAAGDPLPTAADAKRRIVVGVPAGVDGVRLLYREPALARGARNAALLLALALLPLLALRSARNRRARIPPTVEPDRGRGSATPGTED